FVAITCLLVFAALEIESYAFAALSIASGNSFSFYRADVFDVTREQLGVEDAAGPLGWPRTDDARMQPREQRSVCGSAFGDSFTNADEVEDGEAWPYLLSEILGCKVQNFGVGGYGLDQSVLRYERISPTGSFVIIGLFIEMLRRDLAASWTFYAGPIRN